MQERTIGPGLAAMHRIHIPVMRALVDPASMEWLLLQGSAGALNPRETFTQGKSFLDWL
jgi:hypothetical protein